MPTLRTIGRPKLASSNRAKVRLPDKRADAFYLSSEWRDLMGWIKAHRSNACEDPKHNPGLPRSGVRLFGDHVVELKDGGAPLDPRNILLRCPPCHARKTMDERRKRYHNAAYP